MENPKLKGEILFVAINNGLPIIFLFSVFLWSFIVKFEKSVGASK